MTLNLTETLTKTSIDIPIHTNNTKIHFPKIQIFQNFGKYIFSKFLSSLKSAFSADCHGPPLAGLKLYICHCSVFAKVHCTAGAASRSSHRTSTYTFNAASDSNTNVPHWVVY